MVSRRIIAKVYAKSDYKDNMDMNGRFQHIKVFDIIDGADVVKEDKAFMISQIRKNWYEYQVKKKWNREW